MNAIIHLGAHGLVAPRIRIDRTRPLVGVIGSIAWCFDGAALDLRRIVSIDELVQRGRR